ncbi:unnamed protein product [Didymodactylos carnosus]|uniref:Uncharacterized protein n=1 Tax=Didymodactylos carnosus TaxID=1234261 RepID=A0A8S2IEJ4_9BILA|nr:unnamed protein product [Didymodactylos carnosus]CAF3746823.1 unnamed protein product [Didymodactylos carnosus]
MLSTCPADDKHNPTSENSPKSSQQNDDRLVCGGLCCRKCGGCREWKNSPGGGCKYYRKHDGFFSFLDPRHGYRNSIPRCYCLYC